MSINPNRENFIRAILSNDKLSEEEKSAIISDFMEEFRNNYPDLHNHSTKNDILRLEKEIHEIKKDITQIKVDAKNSELKLTKEIEKVKLDLTKEIEKVRLDLTKEIEKVKLDLTKEIKEVDAKIDNIKLELTKEIDSVKIEIQTIKSDTIKFVAGMMIGQVFVIGGMIVGIFKFFMGS